MSEAQGKADSIYIHLDFELHPDTRIEGVPLAGEGFWCTPNGDGTYTVDNLLSASFEVGFRDVIRCKDQGTEWGEREFYDVIKPAICTRFIIAPPSHIDHQHAGQFVKETHDAIKKRWPDAAMEGGMGMLMVQTANEEGDAVLAWLEDREYPHMACRTHEEFVQ